MNRYSIWTLFRGLGYLFMLFRFDLHLKSAIFSLYYETSSDQFSLHRTSSTTIFEPTFQINSYTFRLSNTSSSKSATPYKIATRRICDFTCNEVEDDEIYIFNDRAMVRQGTTLLYWINWDQQFQESWCFDNVILRIKSVKQLNKYIVRIRNSRQNQ